MPIRKKDYPPDWDTISLAVRAEAGQRCEWCGAPNRKVIYRTARAVETELRVGCGAEIRTYAVDWTHAPRTVSAPGSCIEERTGDMDCKRLRYFRFTHIVLTVAHIDRDTKNNERSNLAALCQRCHLRHDIRQHIANRRYGRYHDREHQAKLEL